MWWLSQVFDVIVSHVKLEVLVKNPWCLILEPILFAALHFFVWVFFSVPVQTSDATKVGQNKRRTYKRQNDTNVGLVQTSDWYKRWTGTNVGLVQTSDQYKRRTSTNVGPVHVGQVHLQGKTSDFGWVWKKKTIAIRDKLKITNLLFVCTFVPFFNFSPKNYTIFGLFWKKVKQWPK